VKYVYIILFLIKYAENEISSKIPLVFMAAETNARTHTGIGRNGGWDAIAWINNHGGLLDGFVLVQHARDSIFQKEFLSKQSTM